MPLSVSYYPSATEAFADALSHLDRATAACDLFGEVHVLVPTVGMKSWLTEQLAQLLGASGNADGVVANVRFHMPNVLTRGSFGKREDDSWAQERVTGLLFEHFASQRPARSTTERDGAAAFIASSGGPLAAAARLAGMFNKYSSRRLAMLQLWARGQASLMPVASEMGGEGSPPELAATDLWQFEAWRHVFQKIDETHPRMDVSLSYRDAKDIQHLLVFGFETLDHDTIQMLQRYGETADVNVLMLTPSMAIVRDTTPELSSDGSQELLPRVRRNGEACPATFKDSLETPFHWYRGVRETLSLLAAAGVPVAKRGGEPASADSNLKRLQHVVRTGEPLEHGDRRVSEGSTMADSSLALHLCHGKARQAEVVADAVIAALQDRSIPELQLHEIAIVTPDIASMAPHLQAAFGKTVTLEFESSVAAQLPKDVLRENSQAEIPILIADRSIGELNDGVRFFVDLLSLLEGRVDKTSFFDLVQQPEFAKLHDFGAEQFNRWSLMTERAEQRWAIDNQHRTAVADPAGMHGASALAALSDKHTWLNSARRILLGAIATRDASVPSPQHVPIEDVDAEELRDVLHLLEIIDSISDAIRDSVEPRSAAGWSAMLKHLLRRLCGGEPKFARVPLTELDQLQRIDELCDRRISYQDVRRYLQAQFGLVPDSSFRRDGKIIVTNMASQHLVPRRVICVVGLDDASLPAGALDGNDLTGRQVVEGDADPRHDLRRQLLDAIMSASDRVILACDGRSSKNNQPIDLVTPLNELLDYAKSVGTKVLTLQHPRHRMSERNFLPAGHAVSVDSENDPLPQPWSFDASARDIVESSRKSASEAAKRSVPLPVEFSAPLQLKELRKMLTEPISVFLEQQLKIYRQWEDEETDYGLVPLTLERSQFAELLRQLLDAAIAGGEQALIDEWRQRNRLPLTKAAEDEAIDTLKAARDEIAKMLSQRLQDKNDTTLFPTPLQICTEEEHRLTLPSGRKIDHRLPVLPDRQNTVVLLKPERIQRSLWRFIDEIALEYLFAVASGLDQPEWYVLAETKKYGWLRFEVGIEWGQRAATTVDERRVSASTWLDELCSLWEQSAAVPIPTFGDERTDSAGHSFFIDHAVDAAEEKFDDFISPRDYGNASPFATKDEALVFGAEPEFATCFIEGGPESHFWTGRHRIWTLSGAKVTSVPRRPVTLKASNGSKPKGASKSDG